MIPLVAVSIIVVGVSSFIPFIYFKKVDVMLTTIGPVPWWDDEENMMYIPGAVYLAICLIASSSEHSLVKWAKAEEIETVLNCLHGAVPQLKWREISDSYCPKLILNFPTDRKVKIDEPSDEEIDEKSRNFHILMEKEREKREKEK